MKILAIRGANLASLAGTFEVSLEADPLAGAGLFAIVGETGAGKTTLLDAMCAALFDKTPRLEGHSGFKVGHPRARGDDEKLRLGTSDVRALVRNGETGGWAEVDFEGRDRRRYRARWEVQRARKKLDGRWQDQKMSLVRLDDGAVLGGTRTETLAAIRGVLGLSYDEFCRSALLAQFQFSRFLKASASERAELLERMTGTRVYGDLSKAAFARARALGDERRRLADEVAREVVLDDDARAAAERGELTAREDVAQGKLVAAALAAAGAWRERAAALRADVGLGDAVAEEARARRMSADPVAREIAAVERVALVREPWRARGEAATAMVMAGQAVEKAEAARVAAAKKDGEASARAARARAQVAEAARVATAAAPELARARVLDASVAEARRRVDASAADATASRARAAAAAEQVGTLAGAETAAAQVVSEGARWLAARAAHVRMATDPARWRAVFERVITGKAALEGARRALDAIAPAMLEAEDSLARAEADAGAAHAAHERARAEASAAEAQLRDAPLAPAERALESAERRAKALETLAGIAADARRAVEDEAGFAAAADAAQRAADAALVEIAEVGARLVRETAARAEAEDTLARLRKAAGHEAARAELREGEECPVCGATEHPWRGGVVDALVAEQLSRVNDLRGVTEMLARSAGDAEVRARLAAGQVERKQAEAAEAAAERLAANAAWREALAAAGELPLVGEPASEEAARWLDGAGREAMAARARAVAARDAARAVAEAASAKHGAVLAAVHALEEARQRRDAAREAAAALDAKRKDGERAREQHGATLADARGELAEVLAADELRALDRDAVALRDRVMTDVQACLERTAAIAVAKATLEQVRPALAAATASAKELAEAALERAAAAEAVRGDHARLAGERAALLGGRAVDELERDLAIVRERAAGEELAAREDESAAGRALSSAQTRLDAAIEVRTAAIDAHARAVEAVAAALARVAMTERDAAPLIARDAAWLTGARAQVRVLEDALEQASAVAAERHRLLAEHAGRRSAHDATMLDEPELQWQERVKAATARAESAAKQLRALELLRQTDDGARARRAEAMRAAEAHDVMALPFEQLSEVIGSADGREMRNFAQSLSLDALLAAANHHLDQLAPRYQLERVPGLDLDLHVIDREMGGDARAINSLSGGESFLVSLALALGLSSMAAADVEVRTLFIDEGFGSLDPATLEAALGVLDQLRASGRQVGIVSHVAELEERVTAAISVRAVGGGRSVVEVRGARS
ncbi:MAG TPA: AAA family ATPase [Kofleriaceae bacterium]|nr:AAA family ATPase [Kofleriaceae bacterium]